MAYEIVHLLLNLLSTSHSQYQELVLINQLNNFFCFDHNIFLFVGSDDINRYILTSSPTPTYKTNEEKFIPRSIYRFTQLEDNTTGLETLKEIKSKNTFLIVVPESSNFEKNLKFLAQVKSIQRLQINVKIGVFFSDIPTSDNILKLFKWCWNHRILNVFSAFHSVSKLTNGLTPETLFKVFTYHPFGTFKVINVERSETFANYFPSKWSNMQQYPLRIPSDDMQIVDYDQKFWKTVLAILNATVTLVQINGSFYPSEVLDFNLVDLIPFLHVHSAYKNAYPLTMDSMVIVVPEALPFSDFMAYLRRITSAHLFGYCFITIVTIISTLTISGYIHKKKLLFFQFTSDVFNLLMNDNAAIKYRQLSRVEGCLIIPLTFVGFVIANGILSIFQSYVTLPVIQPQINTVEDVYRSPFPILAPDLFWASEITNRLKNLSKHGDWSEKVSPTSTMDINQQIFTFNNSISFPTLYTHAKMILDIQKRLDIRGYHIPSELYLFKSLFSYSVNDNFPFIERLNDIIHSIKGAGLFEKWMMEHNEIVTKIIIRENRGGVKKSEDIDNFPIPTVVVYGWIVSIIVFFIEIIWKKFRLPCKMR